MTVTQLLKVWPDIHKNQVIFICNSIHYDLRTVRNDPCKKNNVIKNISVDTKYLTDKITVSITI